MGNKSLKSIFRRERVLGILLACVVILPPEYFGFRLSTNLGIPWVPKLAPIIISQIIVLGIRIILLCIGILMLLKLINPYVNYSLWVDKSSGVYLYSEAASMIKRISWRQVFGIVVSCFMIGYGFYGLMIIFGLLLRLILKGFQYLR